MKFIFAALTAAVCLITGFHKGKALSERVKELEGIIFFLNRCKSEIKYRESRITDIINDFSRTEDISLDFLDRCVINCVQTDFPSAWKKSVNESRGHLTERDRENLRLFGEKIGTSDTSSQLSLIDFYILCFEESLKTAKEKEKSDKKLYYAMGASAGLVISIMMI